MPTRTTEPSALLFCALAATTLIGPLSIHMFLPALPPIMRGLAVDSGTAQLSFSIALLTMAAATPVYGLSLIHI